MKGVTIQTFAAHPCGGATDAASPPPTAVAVPNGTDAKPGIVSTSRLFNNANRLPSGSKGVYVSPEAVSVRTRHPR